MNRITKVLATALTSGAVAALPAAAIAAPTDGHTRHHKAHASGGDVAPTLPSIVRVRIDRGTKALETAGDYVDQDMPDKAIASLLNARRNMYAAWRGAKYVIATAPPPPAEDASFNRKAKASGGAVGTGTTYADPPTTAVAVLGFQHTVASAAYGLLDGAKGTLRDAVSTTIFAALNRRDDAINFIHLLPPPPAEDARVHTRAHASGGAVVGDFSTLMPGIVPDLDDEIQQVEGLLNGGALTPGEKRIMNLADVQVIKTERTVNQFWPPVPAEA